MQPRIVILTGNHICHNPRAFKEAETLTQAGFEVELLGGWLDPELAARDRNLIAGRAWRFTTAVDSTMAGPGSRMKWNWQRARHWLGLKQFQWLGLENAAQLGYCGPEMLVMAQQRQADLYIAHSESALWVAAQLAGRGRRIGVDMEDWFSEALLPDVRKGTAVKLLRSLESRLLKEGALATCTSQAMSAALAGEYHCRPPVVIYNAFPWADRQKLDGCVKDRKERSVPSIHWSSQTLGHGRGLEDLVAALPFIQYAVEIHLRGKPVKDFIEWFQARVPEPWRKRIFIHGLVANDELLSRLAEHDIGFAGEMKNTLNHDLTTSNKILHYLTAGLAVVASDTSGQREIAQQAGEAVRLYPSGDPQALAAELNLLLGPNGKLLSAKAAALAAAEETFCWERQAPILVDCIKNALTR